MIKRVENIRSLSPFTEDLNPKEMSRILQKYGDDIKETDYE